MVSASGIRWFGLVSCHRLSHMIVAAEVSEDLWIRLAAHPGGAICRMGSY